MTTLDVDQSAAETIRPPHGLREVARLMFRLGWTAFGGPAAHIAMLRAEVVTRRNWMTDQQFLDIVGASNLVPGPTSTQTVMHTGYARAGWPGLFLGGTLFILPAAALVLACAWLYERFGATPGGAWVLYGIKPVVIAIVVQALWNLGRTAFKNIWLSAVGVGVFVLYLVGINEIVLLFGAAALVTLVANARRFRSGSTTAHAIVPLFLGLGRWPTLAVVVAATTVVTTARTQTLFFTFLKIGAVLYGSGYVLLAFLRDDFVNRLGYITNQQLLDAVAVGQFTPGPVFTTATFVGYLAGGFTGAIVATVGIFLPAYAFVALSVPLLPHIRKSPWTAAALDGVNVAAVGLMAAVAVELGSAALVDWLTVALALTATVILVRLKVNSFWLILGGAVIGVLYHLIGGH